MLGCSPVTANVLGFRLDVVEIDADAKPHPSDGQTEVAAEVTH
jgi:hypothetical protein